MPSALAHFLRARVVYCFRRHSSFSQSKMATNLASEKKRLGVKKAIAVPKTVTMQALGL